MAEKVFRPAFPLKDVSDFFNQNFSQETVGCEEALKLTKTLLKFSENFPAKRMIWCYERERDERYANIGFTITPFKDNPKRRNFLVIKRPHSPKAQTSEFHFDIRIPCNVSSFFEIHRDQPDNRSILKGSQLLYVSSQEVFESVKNAYFKFIKYWKIPI